MIFGLDAIWSEESPANIKPAGLDVVADGLSLFPIGWSSEGRWATLAGYWGEGREPGVRLIIIDAVTDKLVFRSRLMQWDGPEKFHSFWMRFGSSVSSKVRKMKIEAVEGKEMNIQGREFLTGGVRYTFSMSPPSPAKGAYKILVRSSVFGEKTVYSSKTGNAGVAQLLGVLLSPFESRALAIIREKINQKNKSSYRFVGSHLTAGFSRPESESEFRVEVGGLISPILNGQEEIVKERLARGANPNEVDARRYSALIVAARLGHWRIVTYLLAAGAGPDARDANGRTALHYAAFSGEVPAVRSLLEHGADLSVQDSAGRTASDLAANSELRLLIRKFSGGE